jgi:hypothetical protein
VSEFASQLILIPGSGRLSCLEDHRPWGPLLTRIGKRSWHSLQYFSYEVQDSELKTQVSGLNVSLLCLTC